MRALLLPVFAVLVSASSASHAVYRCDADGKTSYSDQPCAGSRKLDIANPPPDVASNARRIEKEVAAGKKQLQALEAEREKSEAAAGKKRERAARQQAVLDRRCASLERRQRAASDGAAAVAGKAADKARIKAQRAAQAYEQECGAQKRIRPMQAS